MDELFWLILGGALVGVLLAMSKEPGCGGDCRQGRGRCACKAGLVEHKPTLLKD